MIRLRSPVAGDCAPSGNQLPWRPHQTLNATGYRVSIRDRTSFSLRFLSCLNTPTDAPGTRHSTDSGQ